MPFKSKAQAKAAFGGYLGAEMKAKAPEFARATPDIKALPEHVAKKKKTTRPIPDLKKMK
jgi:hypothetical protein